MSSVFVKILNMSFTASFAVFAVIIARALLNKAPKVFSYALWAVVLFRLICPFTLESALSLIPSKPEPISHDIIYSQSSTINSGINNLDETVNQTIETTLPPVVVTDSVNLMGVIIEIGSIIWMLGMVVLIAYSIITYLKLNHNLSTATLVRDNIFETDLTGTAFVVGFINPRIIIPRNMSEVEMNYIVKHEETHIKRFDYIIKAVAFLALIIHWFNPIIWLSYYLMTKDMEMSCDESVMKHTNEDIRADYSKLLLSFSVKQDRLLSPLAFGEGNVKSRIKNILNYKKPSFWIVILAVIILVTVAISFGTDSKAPNLKDDSYVFSGTLSVQVGERYFIAEEQPKNIQEELVYRDFLYTVNGEIHKKYDILADIESLKISIENEMDNTDSEVYTSYILHSLTTIIDKQSQNVEQIVKQYNLKEYEIINAIYTQKHSANKLVLGPQWGDGTMSRNFVVGKSDSDEIYKIYEFLMPISVEEGAEINSELLSKNIKLFSYEDYELISGKEIVDANEKINTILTLNGGGSTGEVSYRDIPMVPNYIKIEIDSGNDSETYFVYETHSKYYVEKPYEKINSITYDDYRDIRNLSYLGTIPNPIYAGVIVSTLTDEEYSTIDIYEIENPQKDDFRKVNFNLHIEYPDNITDKKIELPKIYLLIDKNGENRYWSGNSFGDDNERDAAYGNELIMYVRGLDKSDLREIFTPLEVLVTWVDENNNHYTYRQFLGEHMIFEDEL